MDSPLSPFTTEVLGTDMSGTDDTVTDLLPACYHYYEPDGKRILANPADDELAFVERELSLGRLGGMMKHLWLAGAKHPATQLHLQVAMGREIIVADRMDLHLFWDNSRRIFIKPIPRFLLDLKFWQEKLKCPNACACQEPPSTSCRDLSRKVALGFLYTYACLVSSESDFAVANEKRLLPRKAGDETIGWIEWKALAREVLCSHDPVKVHPRFLRAELRLSRINTIHRFTRLPPFDTYLRGWIDYSSFFHDNLSWIAASTVFIALVLTAMQVGLSTEQLQDNAAFQQVSYGFTVFAILGPICAFGLVILGALFDLAKSLSRILEDIMARPLTGAKALPTQV